MSASPVHSVPKTQDQILTESLINNAAIRINSHRVSPANVGMAAAAIGVVCLSVKVGFKVIDWMFDDDEKPKKPSK